jgi:hypothetical protein
VNFIIEKYLKDYTIINLLRILETGNVFNDAIFPVLLDYVLILITPITRLRRTFATHKCFKLFSPTNVEVGMIENLLFSRNLKSE